ncbi:MAG: hypothetical protein Q8J74_02600 [Candidatus Didemnitutus sp.]|nr:hypothetical protein [Candidatus Didemnitutus sp.]
MSDSNKAVFLSYASQDAGAVKRIAAALRVAGVESDSINANSFAARRGTRRSVGSSVPARWLQRPD